MKVSEVSLYLDFKTDESYTPQKICVSVMNSFQQMQEVQTFEFEEPSGWFSFKLCEPAGLDYDQSIFGPPQNFIKTMQVQVAILANMHQGRDTHVRQVKIFAPREAEQPVTVNEGFKPITPSIFGSMR